VIGKKMLLAACLEHSRLWQVGREIFALLLSEVLRAHTDFHIGFNFAIKKVSSGEI